MDTKQSKQSTSIKVRFSHNEPWFEVKKSHLLNNEQYLEYLMNSNWLSEKPKYIYEYENYLFTNGILNAVHDESGYVWVLKCA